PEPRPSPHDADPAPAPGSGALSPEDLAALNRIREQDILRLVDDRCRALGVSDDDHIHLNPSHSMTGPDGISPSEPLTHTLPPMVDSHHDWDGCEQFPDLPGYTIQSVLATGGMGVIFKAVEHLTDRSVAIKFLHRAYHRSGSERFHREAAALARLN